MLYHHSLQVLYYVFFKPYFYIYNNRTAIPLSVVILLGWLELYGLEKIIFKTTDDGSRPFLWDENSHLNKN